MASTTTQVRISVDNRFSLAWIKAMRWATHLIGPTRAYRLAEWGGRRFLRIRFDDGRWQWFRDPSDESGEPS